MKTLTADSYTPQEVCEELLNGGGAVKFKGLFDPADITEARSIIMAHSEADDQKVTHFQGQAAEDGTINLQRRVWNLLAKGEVFSRMAAHPVIVDCLRLWLGSEFIMGSIAANRICPAALGRNPTWISPIGTSTNPKAIRWG